MLSVMSPLIPNIKGHERSIVPAGSLCSIICRALFRPVELCECCFVDCFSSFEWLAPNVSLTLVLKELGRGRVRKCAHLHQFHHPSPKLCNVSDFYRYGHVDIQRDERRSGDLVIHQDSMEIRCWQAVIREVSSSQLSTTLP
jgi:hypothetical protein